jgi:hypothetical protein
MQHKFNVGDVLIKPSANTKRTVVHVVNGGKEIFGKWLDGSKSLFITDSYVLKNENGYLFFTGFDTEYRYELLNKTEVQTQVQVNNCPRCGGELKDKLSEYTGTIIKKCKCGWCN